MLEELNGFGKMIVVVKSTIPPGTTKKLNDLNKNIDIVFNPEFLTEANFIEDFKNQNRIILGGPDPSIALIEKFYTGIFPKSKFIIPFLE